MHLVLPLNQWCKGSYSCQLIANIARLLMLINTKYLRRHLSAIGFGEIMNTKDFPTLFKLSKLCKEILSTFKVITHNTVK